MDAAYKTYYSILNKTIHSRIVKKILKQPSRRARVLQDIRVRPTQQRKKISFFFIFSLRLPPFPLAMLTFYNVCFLLVGSYITETRAIPLTGLTEEFGTFAFDNSQR